jgi:hypothetical protein
VSATVGLLEATVLLVGFATTWTGGFLVGRRHEFDHAIRVLVDD